MGSDTITRGDQMFIELHAQKPAMQDSDVQALPSDSRGTLVLFKRSLCLNYRVLLPGWSGIFSQVSVPPSMSYASQCSILPSARLGAGTASALWSPLLSQQCNEGWFPSFPQKLSFCVRGFRIRSPTNCILDTTAFISRHVSK